MLRLAGAGQLVIFPAEVTQAGGNAPVYQCGVHLHAFRHGAAVIFVGMNKKSGGFYVLGIAQGRVGPQCLRGYGRDLRRIDLWQTGSRYRTRRKS